MNRRDFFRRASLIAAGAVAADQLDLVERLGWRRKFFAGWSAPHFDSQLDAKLEQIFRETWAAGWNPADGYTIRFARDEPIVMEYMVAGAIPARVIGARYTPDVWAPATGTR